jgi:hypothetical protein
MYQHDDRMYENFRLVMQASKHREFDVNSLDIKTNMDFNYCVFFALKMDNRKLIINLLQEYHRRNFILNLHTLKYGLIQESNDTFISCLTSLFFKIDENFKVRLENTDELLNGELLLRCIELNFVSQSPPAEFWLEIKKQNPYFLHSLLSLDFQICSEALQQLLQQTWVRQETRCEFFQHLLRFLGDRELLQEYVEYLHLFEHPEPIPCFDKLLQERAHLISAFLIDQRCHGAHLLTLDYCGYS